MHPRDGLRIDLRGLEVEATGGDTTPGGFRAVVRGGTVAGLVARPAVVAVGFADLVAGSTGRRLYYRLAVADGDAWYVLEGAKEVPGVWWETTTLFARVMRVGVGDGLRLAAAGSADRLGVLAGRLDGAVPIAAGTLRVRDLVRRATRVRA